MVLVGNRASRDWTASLGIFLSCSMCAIPQFFSIVGRAHFLTQIASSQPPIHFQGWFFKNPFHPLLWLCLWVPLGLLMTAHLVSPFLAGWRCSGVRIRGVQGHQRFLALHMWIARQSKLRPALGHGPLGRVIMNSNGHPAPGPRCNPLRGMRTVATLCRCTTNRCVVHGSSHGCPAGTRACVGEQGVRAGLAWLGLGLGGLPWPGVCRPPGPLTGPLPCQGARGWKIPPWLYGCGVCVPTLMLGFWGGVARRRLGALHLPWGVEHVTVDGLHSIRRFKIPRLSRGCAPCRDTVRTPGPSYGCPAWVRPPHWLWLLCLGRLRWTPGGGDRTALLVDCRTSG